MPPGKHGGCDLPSNATTVGVVADGARRWSQDGALLAREDGNEVWTALTSDGAGGVLAVWYNYGQPWRGAAAQRIERNGYWGYPAPSIASANDLPGDQGGRRGAQRVTLLN